MTASVHPLFQHFTVSKIQEYLQANPGTDLMELEDNNRYSLLHQACAQNQYKICEILLTHLRQSNKSSEEIKNFVNLKTFRQHTAIHFASFNGNIRLIKLLEENRANIFEKTDEGLNVMHFAAVGNQPKSIIYFHSKGVSLQEKDFKGRTPLHLATQDCMIDAISYLIKCGSQLDIRDDEKGFTALHYAVETGSSAIVKKLLLKGASLNIRNNRGELPLDLAVKNGSTGIMILLKKPNILFRFLGIKQGVNLNKSHFTFMMLFIFFFAVSLLNIFIVFPYVQSALWIIFFGLLIGLTGITFLFAWLKDPGFVRQEEDLNILELLEQYYPHQLCSDCSIVKPPRSKHCEICNKCVSVYDHHCTWINNCVGAKNHRYFLGFVFTIFVSTIYVTVLDVVHFQEREPSMAYMANYTSLGTEALVYAKDAACLFCSLLGLAFSFPLLMLNYVQFGNFVKGETTHERYSQTGSGRQNEKRNSETQESLLKGYLEEHSELRGKTCMSNFMDMCYRNARNEKYSSPRSSHGSYESIKLIL